jgi:hypothetical protein
VFISPTRLPHCPRKENTVLVHFYVITNQFEIIPCFTCRRQSAAENIHVIELITVTIKALHHKMPCGSSIQFIYSWPTTI